ncbi:MAG: DUF1127 domain-containing protein [Alphaproteobacteria bacterium]
MRSKLLLGMPTRALPHVDSLFGGSFGSVVVRAAGVLLIWQERATQRHALAALEACMLCDIGLSRGEARREAAKPFWRD